jgi:hypothetical protein
MVSSREFEPAHDGLNMDTSHHENAALPKIGLRARALPPEIVRDLGVELNGGRVAGWMDYASAMLDTPVSTIRGWTRPSNATASRPISGAAANLLILLVLMKRQGVSVDALAGAVNDEARRLTSKTW